VAATVALALAVAGLAALGTALVADRAALDPSAVEVGRGAIPETMPAEFPIPPDAVVGETSVDRGRSTTVVHLVTAGSIEEAAGFFTVGLVSGGFVVPRSGEQGEGWEIRFSRLDLRGTVVMAPADAGTAVTVTIIDP